MPKYGLIDMCAGGTLIEKHKYDPYDDVMEVHIEQDVDMFLNYNKRLLRDSDYDGYTPSRDMQRVASIPPIIIEKWLREENINVFKDEDWPRVLRKLDDPDYAYLRCSDGHLQKKPAREFVRGSTSWRPSQAE